MNDQDLDEYETRLNSASPAPWRRWENRTPAEVVDPDDISIGRIWTGPDADLIIAARNKGPALIDEVRTLRALVRDFLDPDLCWFDHHGYCQVHGWLKTDPACPHGRARTMLTENDAIETKEPTA